MIRHNLDVMHIEKNICDSIIGTVLDIPGKNNKDHLNARRDLKMMKMHEKLLPEKVDRCKYIVPRAPYQLTPQERRQVLDDRNLKMSMLCFVLSSSLYFKQSTFLLSS